MTAEQLVSGSEVVLTDGSTGRYLASLGYADIIPEQAVLSRPELISRIHTEYAQAGSQIVLSASFNATRIRLARYGLAEKAGEINRRAVAIASETKKSFPGLLVAGDMGPAGELLQPFGALSRQDAFDAFAEQAQTLTQAGADFLLLETFFDLEELKVAFSACAQASRLPVVACVTPADTPAASTVMGQSLEEIVRWAEEAHIPVLGVNCGVGSGRMAEIVTRLAGLTRIPLWAKPNAGIPEMTHGEVRYPEGPAEFAESCLRMAEAGCRFVGGCCGTTPSHIRQLAVRLGRR